jgi:hypothetical protein
VGSPHSRDLPLRLAESSLEGRPASLDEPPKDDPGSQPGEHVLKRDSGIVLEGSALEASANSQPQLEQR